MLAIRRNALHLSDPQPQNVKKQEHPGSLQLSGFSYKVAAGISFTLSK